MTETIHPLLSHYSSTKWGGGGGAYHRGGGTYFKFRPIRAQLIRNFGRYERRLFEGGAYFKFRPLEGAPIRGFTVHVVVYLKLSELVCNSYILQGTLRWKIRCRLTLLERMCVMTCLLRLIGHNSFCTRHKPMIFGYKQKGSWSLSKITADHLQKYLDAKFRTFNFRTHLSHFGQISEIFVTSET